MKTDLSNNFAELGSSVKEYLNIRADLVRLSFLEKLTKLAVFSISILFVFVIAFLVLLFAATAFVIWYGSVSGEYLAGLFWVIAFVLLLLAVFFLIRKLVVEQYFVRRFSSILLEDDDDE